MSASFAKKVVRRWALLNSRIPQVEQYIEECSRKSGHWKMYNTINEVVHDFKLWAAVTEEEQT